MRVAQRTRLDRAFDRSRRGREAPFFAGDDFTAADIMMGCPLTTMRRFRPDDLARLPQPEAYLERIGGRPAYRRAMAKAEPGMALLLD